MSWSDVFWKIGIFIIVLMGVIGLHLGAVYLIYLLYTWIAAAWWPGHGVVSDPSYLQFLGLWTFITIVAYLFKGEKK